MQNIKMLAYNFLLEAQFKELNIPIEEIKLALKRQDIILLSYDESDSISQKFSPDVWQEIVEGMNRNDGISVVCKNCTFILYSDFLCSGKKTHVIYHELGHIKAGHKRLGAYRFEENEEQEREAEAFAYYVTAPPCILNEIGGISDYTVSKLTGLDSDSARKAYKLIERDKNERLVEKEKELIHRFHAYIQANKVSNTKQEILNTLSTLEDEHKQNKIKIRRNFIILLVAVALLSACVVISINIYNSNKQIPKLSPDITTPSTPISVPVANQTVWKAKTGDVYHTDPNCHHIPSTAYTMDINDAINAGYHKCKDCK